MEGKEDSLWEKAEKVLVASHNIREEARKLGLDNSAIKNIIKGFLDSFKHGKLSRNLWIVKNKTINAMKQKNPIRASMLEAIVNEIDRRMKEVNRGEINFKDLGFYYREEKVENTEEELIKEKERIELLSGVIGRVAITQSTPATAYSFHVWLKDDESIVIEPGDLLKIDLGEGKFLIAEVDNVKAESDYRNVREAFYSWGFGNPQENSPTRIPIIRIAESSVVYRNDGKNAPIHYFKEVYKATKKELEITFNELIKKEEDKILLGFVKDGFGNLVPVYGNHNFIFGYQAGHVNITGKSGVAGKTSYALFLIVSALTYLDNISFVAFNVKERDLLSIQDISFENAQDLIKYLEDNDYYEEAEMWKMFSKKADPIKLLKSSVKIYKPGEFMYGLQDLLEKGVSIFASLFENEDIDEKLISLLYSIEEEFSGKQIGFDDLIRRLRDKISNSSNRGINQYVNIANIPHHITTVNKFLNRLNSILNRSQVIDRRNPRGSPIKVHDILPKDLWIIDIHSLSYAEQRMIFFSVLRDLRVILEAKKAGNDRTAIDEYGTNIIDIETFPNKISVFVDELNRFAPSSSRSASPIKSFIVDIAARGRSIGLTLIGAEQFASQIDEEVLGNASTYLVGKTEPMEASNSFYRRIPEGLRERLAYLSSGQLILIHEAIPTAMLIRYPRPLHHIGKL